MIVKKIVITIIISAMYKVKNPIDRILSYRNIIQRVENMTPCWEWILGTFESGYGIAWYKGKSYSIHRLSAFLFDVNKDIDNNIIPDFKFVLNSIFCVLHRCDNRICFNPEHLFIGTRKDNALDMYRKGRENKVNGERIFQSKLTTSQILEIREKYSSGNFTQYQLAEEYKVSQPQIHLIIKKKNWGHI